MVEPLSEYAERLQEAMRRAGRNPADTGAVRWLADELGVSYQAVKKAVAGITKMLAADNSAKAAQLLGVDPHWLATGEALNWTPSQTANAGVVGHPVAHTLIQPTPEDEPPKIAWEFILSAAPLPPRFSLAIPDDALAPRTPRGTAFIFSTTAVPSDGDVVIVQTETGRRYARLFFDAGGGTWEARPRDPVHASLHSQRDGLTLLATATHRAGGQG